MVGTWRLLSVLGGGRLSWASSKTECTSSLAFWSVQWCYVCSDLCARLGLAKREQFSQSCLKSDSQIWFGKCKLLFVLCFYESACFTRCAYKSVYDHAKWSSLTVSPSLSCGSRLLFLYAFCASQGKLFSQQARDPSDTVDRRVKQQTGWKFESLICVVMWFRPSGCKLYALMAKNKMFTFFSLSLLFGISSSQILHHFLWHCQLVPPGVCSSPLHLSFPRSHSRSDGIHQPGRMLLLREPSAKFHLCPLGSNYHHLISLLVHPAPSPYTYIGA